MYNKLNKPRFSIVGYFSPIDHFVEKYRKNNRWSNGTANATMYTRGTFAKLFSSGRCTCTYVCVYVLFYVSTKEGEKYLAFDIESQYSAVSATVKLSRNCVRVFYDLLRDIGSWPRYVHCAENYASEPRLPCDVPLSCSFRATRNMRIIYKITFDNLCIFSFSE